MAENETLATEPTELPETDVIELPKDVSVGYVVALRGDGEFVFEFFGQNPGLVELLGLHKYSEFRINQLFEVSQRTGVSALAIQLQQLTETLKTVVKSLLASKTEQPLPPLAPKAEEV